MSINIYFRTIFGTLHYLYISLAFIINIYLYCIARLMWRMSVILCTYCVMDYTICTDRLYIKHGLIHYTLCNQLYYSFTWYNKLHNLMHCTYIVIHYIHIYRIMYCIYTYIVMYITIYISIALHVHNVMFMDWHGWMNL